MSHSGVGISPECLTKYNQLKIDKTIKYIIYKLSDDNKSIVVEETSEYDDWEVFREKLINSKSINKAGKPGAGPRFAVYDIKYDLKSGEGSRNKITFIAWSPDHSSIQHKMIYASSKENLKRSLTGIAHELQANDTDDLEWEGVLTKVSKGLA